MRTVVLYSLFPLIILISCTSRTSELQQTSDTQKKEITSPKIFAPDYMKFFDVQWADSSLWDDGLAEVNTIKAERVIYGKTRQYTMTMIVVKEVFNREYNVKTDTYRRKDNFTVMKMNIAQTIMTDIYPYHYLTSSFFLRDNPVLCHKTTQTSQEWCGNTMKRFDTAGDSINYTYDTYWDGEGKGTSTVPFALLEHQLFYTLRALRFSDALSFTFPMIPSIITNKARLSPIINVRLAVQEESALWKVTLVSEDGAFKSSYSFSKQYPHTLVSYSKNDGSRFNDVSTRRYAYW